MASLSDEELFLCLNSYLKTRQTLHIETLSRTLTHHKALKTHGDTLATEILLVWLIMNKKAEFHLRGDAGGRQRSVMRKERPHPSRSASVIVPEFLYMRSRPPSWVGRAAEYRCCGWCCRQFRFGRDGPCLCRSRRISEQTWQSAHRPHSE